MPMFMCFGDTKLARGTCFCWEHQERLYLITNWHNLSGRNPETGKHLSNSLAEPDRVHVAFKDPKELGRGKFSEIKLFDTDGLPVWQVHPTLREKVDIAAIPFEHDETVSCFPINRNQEHPLKIEIGDDVFVLGYPFEPIFAGLPVWKRGSIASEPQISPDQQRHLLVDTASRPGMSGSPVIIRSKSVHRLDNQETKVEAGIWTRFVGVYSGRIKSKDALDTQLGLIWPRELLVELLEGQTRDRPPR